MADNDTTAKAREAAVLNLDELNAAVSSPRKPFQYMVLILLALNYFPLVFNHVIMAFYGSTILHVCHLTDTGNNRTVASTYMYMNVTVLQEVGEKCQTTLYLENGDNSTVTCEAGRGHWTYKPEFDETTIVSEGTHNTERTPTLQFDLVCDDKSLGSLATTIYFCGVMVGGLFFGYVSDTIGRLPVLFLTLYLPIAVGVGIAFVDSYVLFAVLRFIQGIIIQGLQNATYVLAMEFFVPAQRPLVGAVLEGCWGMAVMTLAGLAYLLKDWRHLQLAISLPSLLAVFYICVMPESLRWLVMKGRMERAEKLLTRISSFNKIPFPKQVWDFTRTEAEKATTKTRYNFIHLFKTPRLRRRSLIGFYLWLTVSAVYYGLTFMITSLPGNKYLNFFIGGAVEFVAYISSLWIMNLFGHKKPMMVCFFASGICCVIAASVPAAPKHPDLDIGVVSTTFAVIGRFFVAGLFAIIFVYTTTLYPTVIRIIGLGTCLFWARLGGVIAPQINRLGAGMVVLVPILVFGCMTLVAGFFMLWMPETHRRKMPDTIDDVEHPGHDRDGVMNRPVPYYEQDVQVETVSDGVTTEKYDVTRL
ncbi:hypothetical protein BaRGS_00009581 [Batillaria attramentaria]|uniref:Major facilitator superfamily (MFS) profile domain-containing protein n=1 Tax=Batillaria attramentaria TaxID=370345 RepID=A0ABD0LHH1_9CAEN